MSSYETLTVSSWLVSTTVSGIRTFFNNVPLIIQNPFLFHDVKIKMNNISFLKNVTQPSAS